MKETYGHHNLQMDTLYRQMFCVFFYSVGTLISLCVCVCVLLDFLCLHKKEQSLSSIVGFLLLKKMSSFFPSSVWPNEDKKLQLL